jgi:predicted Rossmann-fold nucleotide-binding protein
MSLPSSTTQFVVCTGGGGSTWKPPTAALLGCRRAVDRTPTSPPRNEQRPNPYVTPELSFEFHSFFMRKLCSAHLARALVVFPGGLRYA